MSSTSLSTAEKTILMPKRERLKVERVAGDRNRILDRDARLLWYDTRGPEAEVRPVAGRLLTLGYTGVVLYPETASQLSPLLPPALQRVIHIASIEEWRSQAEGERLREWGGDGVVISSPEREVLEEAKAAGFATCYRAYVDDAESLHASIAFGSAHSYLMVAFRDPTNIPLELVIASLQATATCLIKEITDPENVDDAIVTLGVMEVGADGVMFSPKEQTKLDALASRLQAALSTSIAIQPAKVIRSEPVGMGYRSCIDLATLFSPNEGMLVGSTSQGGILCCPEVFFLPYMELRPFRVNAGAVHSYVYNLENRTDYMTELRAGSPVMIVGTDGKVRRACVGRMKTEVRPLRLIEAEFVHGERINILMQDDWHVRVFSAEGRPLNITELRPGDEVLAHLASVGRHVGIKVDEHIVEN